MNHPNIAVQIGACRTLEVFAIMLLKSAQPQDQLILATRYLKFLYAPLIPIGLYFLVVYAFPRLLVTEAGYGEYYWPRRTWLFTHVFFGLAATLLGPLQFVQRIRDWHLGLHRNLGRVYLISVLVSPGCAIYLALTSAVTSMYTLGLVVVASLWIASGIRAYWLIRKRQVAQHRAWMVRNYVITFFFITYSFFTDILFALNIGTVAGVATAGVWICWVVPLSVTEYALRQGPRCRHVRLARH